MTITTLHGDCREVLATLPERSVQCVVTSPPYYGLRKYSDDPREIGQEPTPAAYVAALVEVFRQVRRVLRDDGVVWLNLGDSYAMSGTPGMSNLAELGQQYRGGGHKRDDVAKPARTVPDGLKPKDLIGIPWRVAFALQDDGWYLRSDIIWSKPNCMPESVTDRPTRAHEYVFLLAKNARYYYDAAAIAEAAQDRPVDSWDKRKEAGASSGSIQIGHNASIAKGAGFSHNLGNGTTRNRRTVWSIPTQPYSGAHYATMPEALIEPCILAGSAAQACEHCGAPWVRVVERTEEIDTSAKGSKFDAGKTGVNGAGRVQAGDRYIKRPAGFRSSCACENTGSAASVVLDPFGGSGTVGRVAMRLQRSAVLIELNAAYIADHIDKRTDGVQVELFV